MKSDINSNIIEKINESSVPNNVKEFLYEILEFEYEHIDESNPRFTNEYKKIIQKYKQ